MKSLEDLKKLREEAKRKIELRDEDNKNYRVIVGMATCGIAAGARPVLNAIVEECAKADYSCVVTQTGCIGMCNLEPIVEVFDQDGEKTTYVKMTPEKAVEMMQNHIAKGNRIDKYTVSNT